MKKNTLLVFLSLFLLIIGEEVKAQQYEHFEISSGFTADVIANGVGNPLLSTSIGVDGGNWAFLSTDFQITSPGTTYPNALPSSGLMNSIVAASPGLSYHINSYSEYYAIRSATSRSNGTLTLAYPLPAFSIYILGACGDRAVPLSGTINSTDNSTQTFPGT